MDGHGTSPKGRCDGIPDPNEVSSLGKLSVFLISYNLIARKNISTDFGVRTLDRCIWQSCYEAIYNRGR